MPRLVLEEGVRGKSTTKVHDEDAVYEDEVTVYETEPGMLQICLVLQQIVIVIKQKDSVFAMCRNEGGPGRKKKAVRFRNGQPDVSIGISSLR